MTSETSERIKNVYLDLEKRLKDREMVEHQILIERAVPIIRLTYRKNNKEGELVYVGLEEGWYKCEKIK